MKKKMALITMVLLSAGILGACGNGSNKSNAESESIQKASESLAKRESKLKKAESKAKKESKEAQESSESAASSNAAASSSANNSGTGSNQSGQSSNSTNGSNQSGQSSAATNITTSDQAISLLAKKLNLGNGTQYYANGSAVEGTGFSIVVYPADGSAKQIYSVHTNGTYDRAQ